jgi:hypothetical protein
MFLDNHHLLIGDFSQNGFVGPGGAGTGQLIEISEVSEPAAAALVAAGLTLLLRLVLRRRLGAAGAT